MAIAASSANVNMYSSMEKVYQNNKPPQEKKPRRHRTHYTSAQIQFFEACFTHSKFPESTKREQIALQLNLTENQVRIWFKNRRSKERKQGRTLVRNENWPQINFTLAQNPSYGIGNGHYNGTMPTMMHHGMAHSSRVPQIAPYNTTTPSILNTNPHYVPTQLPSMQVSSHAPQLQNSMMPETTRMSTQTTAPQLQNSMMPETTRMSTQTAAPQLQNSMMPETTRMSTQTTAPSAFTPQMASSPLPSTSRDSQVPTPPAYVAPSPYAASTSSNVSPAPSLPEVSIPFTLHEQTFGMNYSWKL